MGLIQLKKKKQEEGQEDFGSVIFYCKRCNKTFDMEWETIWDMQELTHGYVGYHLYDTYICCPDCGELAEALEEPGPNPF